MAVPTNNNVVFGDLLLPLVEEVARPRAVKPRQSAAPGLARSFGGGSLADANAITIKGILKFTGKTRSQAISAFSAALPEGMIAPLYIGDTTRYLLAEVYTLDCDEKTDLIGAVPYDLVFMVYDPFYFDPATSVVNFAGSSSAPTGGTINYTGTAPTRPQIVVSVSSVPATAGVGHVDVLGARQSGTGFRLYPSVVGDVLVDCYAEGVTRGGVDVMGEFQGVFIGLQEAAAGVTGANPLAISVGGGLGVSNVRVSYQNRYR